MRIERPRKATSVVAVYPKTVNQLSAIVSPLMPNP
jgi:hypothetical protein